MLRAGLDLVHLSLCAVRFSRIPKDSLTPSPVPAPSRNGAYCLSPWVIPVLDRASLLSFRIFLPEAFTQGSLFHSWP